MTYNGLPIVWNKHCTASWYALVNGMWTECDWRLPVAVYITVWEVKKG